MYPHLFFIKPESANLGKQNIVIPRMHKPSLKSRKSWFERKFEHLKKALEEAQISAGPSNNIVEKVLVIQVNGGREKLLDALAKLPNSEPLVCQLWDYVEANEDFYFEDAKTKVAQNKKLPISMYLTMSSQQAVNELEKLWRLYCENEKVKFPRGLNELKKVFDFIYDIRFWNEQDRLYHTATQEKWAFMRDYQSQQEQVVEVELWFRQNTQQQLDSELLTEHLIRTAGGQVLSRCCIPEIHYHALLVILSPADIQVFIDNSTSKPKYVYCDRIRVLSPCGHGVFNRPPSDTDITSTVEISPLKEPAGPTQVAMLDGMPLAGHKYLVGRIEQTANSYLSKYRAGEQEHGTQIASIILHGDLGNESSLNRRIHAVSIMEPDAQDMDSKVRRESIPFDKLPVAVVYEAVQTMFEGRNGQAATAPQVKVINLSVCDDLRLFDKTVSPWARLIDWLSFKYNLLFIISAGNHAQPIELSEIDSNEDLNHIEEVRLEKQMLDGIHRQMTVRQLMSPSEAVNALTVNALHQDNAGRFDNSSQTDPFITAGLPSPVNSVGMGYKKSVKPELMLPGGRQTYEHVDTDGASMLIEPKSTYRKPGLKVALPSVKPGKLDRIGYSTGTSLAAAYATHHAAKLLEILQDYRDHDDKPLNPQHLHVLVKALLAHGCEEGRSREILFESLSQPTSGKNMIYHHFFGYGANNTVRIKSCKPNQATLIYSGEISTESSLSFVVPLPNCLNLNQVDKRFIFTLAWHSRINPGSHLNYRRTKLKFNFSKKMKIAQDLALSSRSHDHHAIGNGTLQHEVFSGDKSAVFGENAFLDIAVDAYDSKKSSYSVPFAFVVTIDSSQTNLPIYQEVKNAIELTLEKRGILARRGVL